MGIERGGGRERERAGPSSTSLVPVLQLRIRWHMAIPPVLPPKSSEGSTAASAAPPPLGQAISWESAVGELNESKGLLADEPSVAFAPSQNTEMSRTVRLAVNRAFNKPIVLA